MTKAFLRITFGIVLILTGSAHADPESGSPELVVHLLDYLAKDYAGAVQGGVVVSPSEYAEQVEFAQIVEKNTSNIPSLKNEKGFHSGVEALLAMIRRKEDAAGVSKLARKLQQDVIQIAGVAVAPNKVPDIVEGAKLYQLNCTSCHGTNGMGDGVAGKGLDPKPANFLDPALVRSSSPYMFYNTIRLGVPGTGMSAFSQFSDQEVWNLAFYLKSLAHPSPEVTFDERKALTLAEAAGMTDDEIVTLFDERNAQNIALLGAIRKLENGSIKSDSPLQLAERLMNNSVAAAKRGNSAESGKFALRAYLEGIEPVEPKIRANLPGTVEELEFLMSRYRSAVERGNSVKEIELSKAAVSAKLTQIEATLQETKMSPAIAFGAALTIFLREGFEAVLIIIVLLSILRAMGQGQAMLWVHFGWISALTVGVGAWFASGSLLRMSGLSRELLEGGIALTAVVVLIYVGFWLHRYSEAKRWRLYLEAKLKHGLSTKSFVGLAMVSFMAVFREAFEVVLFLRAIWTDLDSNGQSFAGAGVATSILLLSVLSFVAVRQSRRLRLEILFQACSWTMMALAIVLAGKGIHSLQEAGIVSVSSFPVQLRWDFLGIYPSYQTLAFQFIVVGTFAALFWTGRRTKVQAA